MHAGKSPRMSQQHLIQSPLLYRVVRGLNRITKYAIYLRTVNIVAKSIGIADKDFAAEEYATTARHATV
jgi:hypothetical protein